MGMFGRSDGTIHHTFVADDKMTPVVKGIRRTMDQFKKDATQGFGLAAGISVWGTAQRAIGAVVDIAGDAVRAFAEDERSIAQLTTALEANIDAWDGNADSIEDVIRARMRLGFSDDEQRASLAKLVSVTKDASAALDVQRTAMDLARLRNMSLADASELLGKVYAGNVGILSRYGIQLKRGTTATEALAEIQRRAAGQADAFADTVSGKMLAAQLEIGEAMEKVGEVLTPVALGFATFAADVIPDVVSGLGDMGDAFNNLHRFMDPGLATLQDLERAVRMQAVSLGLDADAAWEYVRAQQQQAEVDAEIVRWKERLIAEGRSEAEAMALINEEMRTQGAMYEEVTKAVEEQATANEEASRFLEDYQNQWVMAGGVLIKIPPKLKAVTQAAEDAGDMLDPSNPDGPAAAVRGTTRSMMGAMDLLMDPWKEQWRDARDWALDPFTPSKFEDRLQRWAKRAARRAANSFGNEKKRWTEVSAAYRLIIKSNLTDPSKADILSLIAVMRTVDDVGREVRSFFDNFWGNDESSDRNSGGGGKGNRRPGDGPPTGKNALGGPVEAGGTYLVGEHGPELLHMGGNGGGSITSNARMGQPINVYVDGRRLFQITDVRNGRAIAMGG